MGFKLLRICSLDIHLGGSASRSLGPDFKLVLWDILYQEEPHHPFVAPINTHVYYDVHFQGRTRSLLGARLSRA